jgi:HK97 family phage major capsid protein
MATETRDAASLYEERTQVAAEVMEAKNSLISYEGEDRHEKAATLQTLVERLESVDREYSLASALERAEKAVKSLEQKPNRPAPVYTGTVQYDPRTKSIVGGIGNTGFGDSESDPARQSYEYDRAFNEFIKNRCSFDGLRGESRELMEKFGKSEGFQRDEVFIPFKKDMTLGTTTNGSNAVPPDFRDGIITQRTITPVMSRLVQTINTTRTSVTYPRNSDASATAQVGTGFADTKGETPNVTLSNKETGPFTQLEIDINTGTMWTAVSLDFLDDVPGARQYIVNEGMKAFAAAYDNETINGVTASALAEGVLSCASVGITKTGVNNTLVATKVVESYYSFRSQYATRLAWVMARATMGKLVGLLDANNRSLFLPSFEGGYTVGSNGRILSTDVYFNEYCPASGTSLPKSIIVGDWEEYILAMRSGISVVVDTTSWARYNLAIITWRYRFGGAVRDPRAFNIVHETA